MQWLNGQELLTQYLIYCADQEWSEWTRRCVHQADTVILLVDATSKPEFTKLKQELSTSGQKWSIVMLHPEGTDHPKGSAIWRIESGAEQIYHVRKNNSDDLGRIARILTGRALSLVLSGGGARGFAHIGALRALEELDVKVDMVGATSVGAPIAGWIAMGKNAAQCQKLAHEAFHKLLDYTLPSTSLIQGKRMSHKIGRAHV